MGQDEFGHRPALRHTRHTDTTTRSISLSANSTYYLKGYVTTASGTSYTTAKKVRVPK